jgi:hypothetical protein
LVAVATTAAPIAAITGLGSVRDGGSPLLSLAAAASGLALLAYLVLRQRPLLSTVLVAGVLGGWVVGAGIRLAMFVAAEMGGGVERSVDGTVGLILFGAMPGILLSGLALVVRTFTPAGPRGIALLVSAICSLFLVSARAELFARGNGWVNILTFLLAAAAGGAVIGRMQPAVEAWWERREAGRAPTAESAAIAP